MNNFKKISNLAPRIILIMILVLWCVAPDNAFAVPAAKGNFVTLGRTTEDDNGDEAILDEKISLWARPGASDTIQARVNSGIVVLVLDKTTIQGKNFYIVSTVGKDGGIMGWVSEEYIYDITTEPQRE